MTTIKYIFALSLLISASAYSVDYQIVGSDSCMRLGNFYRFCAPGNERIYLSPHDDVIPAAILLQVSVGPYCSTAYPMNINMLLESNDSTSVSALQNMTYKIYQYDNQYVDINLDAPWGNYAYFNSACSINASIHPDTVDLSELAENIRVEKEDLDYWDSIYSDRIADKTLLNRVFGVIKLYKQAVTIALADEVSFAEINSLLTNFCGTSENCTWAQQMRVLMVQVQSLLDANTAVNLMSLGVALDKLVPASCTENNCVSSIVTPEQTDIVESVIEAIKSYDNLDEDIRQLQEEQLGVLARIIKLQVIAQSYGLSWAEFD